MRIAVISDIHANVLALRAVFEDMQPGIDRVLNLGDILYGPLWPRETFEFLREHEAVTIRGNQDREIYETTVGDLADRPILRHVAQDLGGNAIEWLKSLPGTISEGDLFLCHGTPQSDVDYLLENVTSGKAYLRTETEILALLGGCMAPVVACGHTHLARKVRLFTGQLIFNPGSVGLPAYREEQPLNHRMEAGSPEASYAVMEKAGNDWAVELRTVPYDHTAAAKQARKFGEAGARWAAWLETGRASD